MSIKITDTDGISTIHSAERLEINLAIVAETVKDMTLKIYFNVETQLASGKSIGQLYWDAVPLELNCKNDSELAEAMRVIQWKIGQGRYQQMTTPVPEPVESPGMIYPV